MVAKHPLDGSGPNDRVRGSDPERAAAPALRDVAAYRTLFDAIDQGFCLVQIELGDDGLPTDYRFLETNTAFAQQTGLADAVGHTALELLPGLEPWWLDTYAHVARTGESVRLEYQACALGRYFDVFAARVGSDDDRIVAILFRDITDRRAQETALRDTHARQAFLLSLADALRVSATPLAAQKAACRLLGDHLKVDRAFFAELDTDGVQVHIAQDDFHPDLVSVAGLYRAESFGTAMAMLSRGECFAISDMAHHAALPSFLRTRFLAFSIAACLCVPIILGSRMAGAVCVTARSPRVWTDAEADLLVEAGHRIWAAVAQARVETAMRATENRLQTLVEGMPQLVWRASANGRWTWASPQWTSFTGLTDAQSQGNGWLEALHPDDKPVAEAAWANARDLGRFDADYRLKEAATGTFRWFQTRALPVRDDAGHLREWLGTSTDVQDLHDMQERLRQLVAELQHRTRNLMAVVTAVTDRTLASCDTIDAFRPLIQSRLGSIARTSGLLSKLSDDGRISVDELLADVFRGLGVTTGDMAALTLTGPAGIQLRGSSVQTIALAFHELASAALLHGGLAEPGGSLTVAWQERNDPLEGRILAICWTERVVGCHDPRVDHGSRSFGREMIERALPYQLNAQTDYTVSSEGLSCRIILPLDAPGESL